MKELEALLQWAANQGIILNGVKPIHIQGRGAGVIATRRVEAGEVILSVPTSVMHSIESIPRTIREKLPPNWSIHSLLALDLALNNVATPWRAVLPQLDDFKDCMPLLWPPELQALLPRPALSLLERQRSKVQAQWDVISKIFPSITEQGYLAAWLVISTRTFYHLTSETEKYDWEERLTLLPIMDLLNHAETGCQVLYNEQEYSITTDRVYEAGEEVVNSYGEHSNDFLLAEYGFILARNQWDEVCIDDSILPQLSDEQKRKLDQHGMSGNFKIRPGKGVCSRTRHAMRMLTAAKGSWDEIAAYDFDKDGSIREADDLLTTFLGKYLDTVQSNIKKVTESQGGGPAPRNLLAQRWGQIRDLVEQSIQQLEV